MWGLFNQISDRDAYLLQTGWAVLRHFGARLINAAASDGVSWVPHAPIVSDQLGSTANPAAPLAVFASQFEGPKEALWLVGRPLDSFLFFSSYCLLASIVMLFSRSVLVLLCASHVCKLK
eukprot:SAG31_NODE_2255_length_6073_cov_2.134248_4_plen_120_part_00